MFVRKSYTHSLEVQAFSWAGLASKNNTFALTPLCVEDPGWQPQQRMDLAFVQQLAPDGLSRGAFEQDIIGHDYAARP